jgi:PAS domain S-box-containing protein
VDEKPDPELRGGAQLTALVESGQLPSAVLAALPGTAVLVFDRDLRIRHAAGQALERHGWVPEQMEGRTLAELMPPAVLAEIEPHYRAALDGEIVRFDRTTAQGNAIYRTDIAPMRSDGEVMGGVVIARDVTEARAASGALAASERRYRMLAEHATDLISRHAVDSTFLYASPSARELVGWAADDLLGTRALDLQHPDDAAANRGIWRAAIDSPEPRKVEYRTRRADGSYRWVESIVRRVIDERTGAVEVEAVTRDVEERKRSEKVLREAHERFDAAFRHAPIGKAIVALNGRCLKVNEALCEITGYSERELLGKTFQDLTHPDDLGDDVRELGALLAGEIRSYRTEKRCLRADGETIWIAHSGSLVRDSDDRPLYLIAQVQDIEEQRRHQEREREQLERLRELDTLKDEFIGFVSHELRTPLTSIRGYVDLLLEYGDNLTDEQRHFLDTVRRNGGRLNRLIEDLLAHFRLEDGKVEMHMEVVDLAALLAQAAESAGPAAVRKKLSLTTRLASEAPVLGDEGRLAQVIDNLLSNAVKYTPEGGEIEAALELRDGSVVLSVTDTGIGVPEHERAHLFERFFRASTATERAIQGTGLGLAITKGLVEAHGGTIAAEPRDPGTCFVVSLPLADRLDLLAEPELPAAAAALG